MSRHVNQLGLYQQANGLTDDQMAEEISALIGKPVAAQAIRLWSARANPPKAWARALGLPAELPPEEEFLEEAVADGWTQPVAGPPTQDGVPPRAPAGARTASTATSGGRSDLTFARDRIVKAYGFIGGGASLATRNDGFAAVTDQYAEPIADAWVAAAKVNTHVAKVVSFMESGGPVGELVVCHVLLLLGFIYVSGNGPDALGTITGTKFDRYRDAALAERRAAAEPRYDAGPDADGTYPDGGSANGGTDSVADAAAASGR